MSHLIKTISASLGYAMQLHQTCSPLSWVLLEASHCWADGQPNRSYLAHYWSPSSLCRTSCFRRRVHSYCPSPLPGWRWSDVPTLSSCETFHCAFLVKCLHRWNGAPWKSWSARDRHQPARWWASLPNWLSACRSTQFAYDCWRTNNSPRLQNESSCASCRWSLAESSRRCSSSRGR